MFPNIQLQKQYFLRQGWPTSTHWRATQFVRTRPRATFVRTYIEGGTKLTRTPAFTNASFIFFFCYLLKLPYYALQTYHVTVAKLYYWIILVEDIPLCLSIILKWNKIYTSSNTTMLYFINLNSFFIIIITWGHSLIFSLRTFWNYFVRSPVTFVNLLLCMKFMTFS